MRFAARRLDASLAAVRNSVCQLVPRGPWRPPPRLDQTHAGALNILKIWEAWVSGELRPAYLCRPGDDGTGNY